MGTGKSFGSFSAKFRGGGRRRDDLSVTVIEAYVLQLAGMDGGLQARVMKWIGWISLGVFEFLFWLELAKSLLAKDMFCVPLEYLPFIEVSIFHISSSIRVTFAMSLGLRNRLMYMW